MANHFLDGSSILITGGTGSFGRKMTERLLRFPGIRRVIIYSRDELKQFEMGQDPRYRDRRVRYFIGDVRDQRRLALAFEGVEYVIHAAAMKQIPAAEYNPFEAVKTNILGAQNVIETALERDVRRVVALSTDKAANPINLYGATKLCSDKLFISGNFYAGRKETRFAVVRYGNVVGSRGSVVPLFLRLRHQGVLPVTDERMTRFWITLDQGVELVLECLEQMAGGELFVPKIPSMRVVDLCRVIAPAAKLEIIGIRSGEKLHEVMISQDDARMTVELDDYYIIRPPAHFAGGKDWETIGRPCPESFHYASDTNPHWLTEVELESMIGQLDIPEAQAFAAERRRIG